jgi:polygalacturonase
MRHAILTAGLAVTLFLLPSPGIGQLRDAPATRSFDVKDFHAVGDGKHNDTASIQQAIDACFAAGGGDVSFPKGTYRTGSITLKSHVTLNVPEGVIIQGSGSTADYPLATARWEGMEKPAYKALITADHAEQIGIVGKGTIQSDKKIGTLRDPRGPTLIEPTECKGVTIDGPTLHTFKIWALHPTYCQDVDISNLTIENKGGNGDGIDIDSCLKVKIDGCSFDTDDDNISIKSGKGREGVRVGRPSEDITISNCKFIKGYCSIAFGSELSGGIRNVHVQHCSFKQGRGALYFKSRPGRAGYIEDVTAEDLDVGPCPLLVVDMNYGFNVDAQGVAGVDGLTRFKNITIRNAKIDCKEAVKVVSTPENRVEGVTLESITGRCTEPWVFKNAFKIGLKDIHVTGVKKNFLLLENAEGTGLTEANQ